VLKQSYSKAKKFVFKPLLFAGLLQTNTAHGPLDPSQSCAALCHTYPQLIHRLFAHLDLNRPGLEAVQAAVHRRDWAIACEELVLYYRHSPIPENLRRLPLEFGIQLDLDADALLQDTFTFQRATGTVPRTPQGRLNWAYRGPYGDSEWGWFLNRHHHLRSLLDAYQQTGDRAYVQCINDHLQDWITWERPGSVAKFQAGWRGMEVAHRVGRWASLFYQLQEEEALTPATRILMLASLHQHAWYLRHLHAWGANWIINEMKGLALVALCWPEFKRATHWLDYASDRLFKEMQWQVHPDGVHKELTSHYHLAALRNFQDVADLLTLAERPLPQTFRTRLEQMWNYLAYSLRPDGYGGLNNDSDLDFNRPLVAKMALVYDRPDWTYIASNGEAGIPPAQDSVAFPWAGQVVSRSGWDAAAHWAFFDLGPMGIYYHIHNDKLHLSLAAHGRDLLVDSGRYSYVRGKFWQYFRGSASHNVILIDGQGQGFDRREWRQPMANYRLTPEFDFAKGTFNGGYCNLRGRASHTRAVIYLRDAYWLVVDHIDSDRPRQIQPLWHFHPDCTVVAAEDSVMTLDPEVGNLRITPCGSLPWQVEIVAGQTKPVQGWWSREYNHKVPNPTAIYSASIPATATFAWVMTTAVGPLPPVRVQAVPTAPPGWMHLKVEIDGQDPDEIAVRMAGSADLELSQARRFDGECLILRPKQPPLLVGGRLTGARGEAIAVDAAHG
jgi:hypothetical protein